MWRSGSIGMVRCKRFSQNKNRCAFDSDTSQSSRVPRPGVDVDPVMTNIGIRHRRMAVNDKFSVILFRVEKLVTNPEQVLDILLLPRDVGTDTGMYKQEISATKTIVETLQEELVGARKSADKATVQVDFCFAPRARINPIGCKGLHAAQMLPMTKIGWVSKEILHQGFVVAAQAHRAIFDKPDGQQINDSLGIRAAIDVVAQINLDRMLYRPASKVIIDTCNGFNQQVSPAVDIADSIDTCVGRRRSGDRWRICSGR
jgi:hypothetical protein